MSKLDVEALATDVVLLVKTALAPLQAQVAALGAQVAALEQTTARIDGVQRDAAALGERVAVMEVKALQPGPPGPAGRDGVDGKDGAPGMTYQGVFVEGKQYEKGDVTTWAGSMWHANEATGTKPGDGSKAWTLACKHGRDGKDGAVAAPPPVGRRTPY